MAKDGKTTKVGATTKDAEGKDFKGSNVEGKKGAGKDSEKDKDSTEDTREKLELLADQSGSTLEEYTYKILSSHVNNKTVEDEEKATDDSEVVTCETVVTQMREAGKKI